MKRTITMLMILGCLGLAGCSGQFWGGGAAGAVAGGAGYEYHLDQQKKRLERDLKDGKITQAEYDIRLDQVRRDSILQN